MFISHRAIRMVRIYLCRKFRFFYNEIGILIHFSGRRFKISENQDTGPYRMVLYLYYHGESCFCFISWKKLYSSSTPSSSSSSTKNQLCLRSPFIENYGKIIIFQLMVGGGFGAGEVFLWKSFIFRLHPNKSFFSSTNKKPINLC